MAPWNKLLLTGADGRTLVARTVAQLQRSSVRNIHVVVGHQASAVRAALRDTGVAFVCCADHASGLAHSLRAGLAAMAADAAAVLVCLGDMPAVATETIDALIGAWQPGAIVAPVHGGLEGNPVLWDARFVPEMMRLDGDAGARRLFARYADAVRAMLVEDVGVVQDADTREAARGLPGGPWHAPDGSLI